MSSARINLKLLQHYGLTLDMRKKYHIVYECCTHALLCISDDLNQLFEDDWIDREDYKKNGDSKGVMTNLNVWELLDNLCTEIRFNQDDHRSFGHLRTKNGIAQTEEEARMSNRQCIEPNLLTNIGGI
jgi:hypothetical protein